MKRVLFVLVVLAGVLSGPSAVAYDIVHRTPMGTPLTQGIFLAWAFVMFMIALLSMRKTARPKKAKQGASLPRNE